MSWRPPEQDWRNEKRRLHWVKWDPRPAWKRRCEWPLRKFYLINYDPFIWVPEEELVWDTPAEEYARDTRDAWLTLGLLFFFFGGTVVTLYIMSLFFQ